jgi:hypothetical protein
MIFSIEGSPGAGSGIARLRLALDRLAQISIFKRGLKNLDGDPAG